MFIKLPYNIISSSRFRKNYTFLLILFILITFSFLYFPRISQLLPTYTHDYSSAHTFQSNFKLEEQIVNTHHRQKFMPPSPQISDIFINSAYINNSHVFPANFAEDEDIDHKREFVKQMMKHAWTYYSQNYLGYNELKSVSGVPHQSSVFGSSKLGLTLVDSLDTLLIMNMDDEYKVARDWIVKHLDFSHARGSISVFETNIRYIGGLLSVYLMTNDKILLQKAMDIADKLMPAFKDPHGLPYSLVDVEYHNVNNYNWAAQSSFILSEVGTLHLEFMLLSLLSGVSLYAEKVLKIREYIANNTRPDGLVNNYLYPQNPKRPGVYVSMGGLGDSYYEYLLKSYLITKGSNYVDMQSKTLFDRAMMGLQNNLLNISKPSHLTYISQIRDGRIETKMDHLACFMGGLFALAGQVETNSTAKIIYDNLGAEITHTCRESYARSNLRLGPEIMEFDEVRGIEAQAKNPRDHHYLLRPETFESYFVLWRTTHDPKYREWAWDAILALDSYTKVKYGYSGVKNVYVDQPVYDDVQQSYFLAEGLKYLYLIFCPDDFLSLDKWVYNTEAHPLLKHEYIGSEYIIPGPTPKYIQNDENNMQQVI